MRRDPKVAEYLDELAAPEDPVLQEMEALAAEQDFPIVGPQVGRLLQVLAVTAGARRVLELGSGFGYSAYWFAQGVGPHGEVLLTDHSAERLDQAQVFLARAGLGDRARCCTPGDALGVLLAMPGPFDIIFNDIDKERYGDVLEPALERLRPGGLLISDNMLWSGRVADPDPADEATAGVLRLTRGLYDSASLVTALVPLRDGVTVSVRKR